MSSVAETSVVVQTLKRLAEGSRVAGALRAMSAGFRRFEEAIARAAADKEGRADAERLSEIARGSRVVRALDAVLTAPEEAWRHSRTRTFVESARASVAAMPQPDRVRLLGWMVVVAVVTRALMYVWSGAELTAVTVAIWAVVAGAGVVMMSASRAVSAAWTEWRARKR